MSKREANVRIVLASASPRRAALMAEMGYEFEVMPPQVDEVFEEDAAPAETAKRLAVAKAEEVAARAGAAVVVAADTVVALGRQILGKPLDRRHAVEILRKLSGSTHEVITGVCVIDARTGRRAVDSVSTTVTMRRMTEAEIRDYVESGEADGKAGAYAIQETADRYVVRVDGSATNVVGLPTERLGEMLSEFGCGGAAGKDGGSGN